MMSTQTVPAVIKIRKVHDAVCFDSTTSDMRSDLGEASDDNTQTIRQENEVTGVTVENLRAMKEMIREIRENPDLLYEYSTTFSHCSRSLPVLTPYCG